MPFSLRMQEMHTVLMAKNLYSHLPETPGVYLMRGVRGEVLYVGKAGNLRRRVASYFARPHDARIERLVRGVRNIDSRRTNTAIEALILESRLIKKHRPPFNVREKDDKSFLYVTITRDALPRVLLARGKDLAGGRAEQYGPFTSASSIREALRIIRRIFPYSVHDPSTLGKFARPCFEYEIGLCPGTCVGAVRPAAYRKNIRALRFLFQGSMKKVFVSLNREMRAASRALNFENAEKIRRQLFALRHIEDIALIRDEEIHDEGSRTEKEEYRIEGYDISNISGTSATGSMAVFLGNEPNKDEYRKFRIKTVAGSDDVRMLGEVLRRRFNRYREKAQWAVKGALSRARGWPLPHLILVDGGKGQVNAAKKVLSECGLAIPVVGIAKGPTRKKNEFIGAMPSWVSERTLIRVRDEAHRFAVAYHRALRSRSSFARRA